MFRLAVVLVLLAVLLGGSSRPSSAEPTVYPPGGYAKLMSVRCLMDEDGLWFQANDPAYQPPERYRDRPLEAPVMFGLRDGQFLLERQPPDLWRVPATFRLAEPVAEPLALLVLEPSAEVAADQQRVYRWERDVALVVGCFYWSQYADGWDFYQRPR